MLKRCIRKIPIAMLVVGLLLAVGASSAMAAPTFTTERATAVAATTATLNATLSQEGHPIDYMFSYGTDPNPNTWSNYTPIKSAYATFTPFSFSEPLVGLKTGTTYYYDVAVHTTDDNKYIAGEVKSFTTLLADGGLQFMAEKYTADSITVQLGKTRVFEALGGLFAVDCKGTVLYGSLTAASNTFSAQPSMSTCTDPAGKVTIKPNSCKYLFDIDHNWGQYAGSFAISCSKEGDAIEYVTEGNSCTIKLLPQSIPSSSWVYYENTGPASARILTLGGWAWGMKWSASGGSCNASGEDGSMGSFDGTTMRGWKLGVPDELFVAGLE